MTTSIDRYKTLGVQFSWVRDYFEKKNDFWDNNNLGTMMLSPLKAFLADTGVSRKGKITAFGELVDTIGIDSETAWALMLCNAAYTSEINWWVKNISFNRPYTPAEIMALLMMCPQKNPGKTLFPPLKICVAAIQYWGTGLALVIVTANKRDE